MQSAKNIEFVITGCGRSGTGYVSELLNSAGLKCGHESVFGIKGPGFNGNHYRADASWFSAPFLSDLPPDVKILHIVRNPAKVVSSFHRIGLCADTMWIQFSKGKTPIEFLRKDGCRPLKLRKHFRRFAYVRGHRQLLGKYTTCLGESSEVNRLWQYWYQWNKLVEKQLSEISNESFVIRLEDVESRLEELEEFFGIKNGLGFVNPANLKRGYRKRSICWENPGEEVLELARYYGYSEEDIKLFMK